MVHSSTPRIAGRERQQARLLTCLDATARRQGSLAILSGEAGIGKSTLAGWLASEATQRGFTVLVGGCYDLTVTPPYGPWLELSRSLLRQGHDDLLTHLTTNASRQHTDGPSPFFDGLIEILNRHSTDSPVLLVLEDLHWADDASLELLRVVARETRSMPIMLLATWRAEEVSSGTSLARFAPLIVRETDAERIELLPLDAAGITDLIAGRYAFEEADRARVTAYLERYAGGNPLYAIELLRELEDQCIIVPTGDHWAAGDTSALRLPRLLQQMIEARFLRLGREERDRLTTAAVIGDEIPLDTWRAICGMTDEQMIATVEQAVMQHLIIDGADGTRVRFSHSLVREALYQAIPSIHRRQLHRQIAEVLEHATDPDPDAIAWHYRMGVDDRAVAWLLRAAERAQRAYAWTMAADRLELARERLPANASAAERGWLAYRIGRLRRHADPAAIEWLAEAERAGRQSGDRTLEAYATFDLGHARVLTGDYVRGLDAMLAGDTLLAGLGDDPAAFSPEIATWVADTLPGHGVAPVLSPHPAHPPRRGTLIQWLVEPGRFDEALSLGERYVAEHGGATAIDDQTRSSLGDAWFGLGRVYAARGDPSRAHAALTAALTNYDRIGHHFLVSSTARVLLAEVLLPYYPENLRQRRQVVATAQHAWRRSMGALQNDLPAAMTTIEAEIAEGSWQASRAMLEQAAQPGATIMTQYERACVLLARLDREQGNHQSAWKWIRTILPAGPECEPGTVGFARAIAAQLVAIDLALDANDVDLATRWLGALDRQIAWSDATRWSSAATLRHARLALTHGAEGQAHRLASEAVEMATNPRLPFELAAASRLLGQIEMEAGRESVARAHFHDARDLADLCDAPYPRALALLGIAETTLASGQREDAIQFRDEALALLVPLGARPAIARANAIDPLPTRDRPFGLSRREREVLDLVTRGMTDAEIADHLSISYRTVTTHLTSVLTKLNVNSRVAATRIAVERGLITDRETRTRE